MPQFKSEKAAAKKINPHVYWSLIFEALKGKKNKQTFTYTAARSTTQSSHLRRTTIELLTRGLPYSGTTLKTKLSPTNIRPQTTDRQTCFTEMGNEQEHFLAPYVMGTHWRCPHSRLKITCGQAVQKCNQIFNTYLVFFFTINCWKDS